MAIVGNEGTGPVNGIIIMGEEIMMEGESATRGKGFRKKKKKRTKVIGLKSDEAFSGLIDKGQTARRVRVQ